MYTFISLPKKLSGLFLTLFFFQGLSMAQNDSLKETQPPSQQTADAASTKAQSDVELLVGISQVIEQDKARLQNLKRDSSRLEPIFQLTTAQFYQVDTQLDSAQNMETSPEKLAMIEHEWEQLRDVLDFRLEVRRSIYQQIKILQRKIDKEQEAINFIMKGEMANILERTAESEMQKESEELLSDSISISDTTKLEDAVDISQTDLIEYNWRVVENERELRILKAKFDIAKKRWFLVEQLMTLNQDDLTIAHSLAESGEKKLTTWKLKLKLLEDKRVQLQAADSAPQLQEVIQNRINEINNLSGRVENILSADVTLVNTLQARIDRLSGMQASLSQVIENATKLVERKSRWLEYLRSPLAPHSVYAFLIHRGPRILVTILGLFLIWTGARWLTQRILKGVVRYKSKEDREERVETLSRAIRSALTVIIVFVGFIILLSELGINVSVFLGGAAVFSLAIAFGMQSLVKDYFSGFMILTENQYRVGNVIRINNISGVVEDISLRSTILRDQEGIAHFIPHGEITVVSNLTHSWSRVALDIGVAYKENVDHVMEVIMEVARGMQEDPEYKKLITGEPEMLGVDAFADSAVVIKMLVKTRPTKQWIIKRELLRRLKNRFDELGIEIPFPHRTVYHKDLIIQELEKGKPKDKVRPVKEYGK